MSYGELMNQLDKPKKLRSSQLIAEWGAIIEDGKPEKSLDEAKKFCIKSLSGTKETHSREKASLLLIECMRKQSWELNEKGFMFTVSSLNKKMLRIHYLWPRNESQI